MRVAITPAASLRPLELTERGAIRSRRAVARVSNLSPQIAKRELTVVGAELSWPAESLLVDEVRGAAGPGNVLTLEIESDHVTEVFTGFGQREITAEQVAARANQEVRDYLASGAPVGPYLADQLLIPMAMAGGGRFRTTSPTRHTLTNVDVIKRFLSVDIAVEKIDRSSWIVSVSGHEA